MQLYQEKWKTERYFHPILSVPLVTVKILIVLKCVVIIAITRTGRMMNYTHMEQNLSIVIQDVIPKNVNGMVSIVTVV